jgi:hypothetical protein
MSLTRFVGKYRRILSIVAVTVPALWTWVEVQVAAEEGLKDYNSAADSSLTMSSAGPDILENEHTSFDSGNGESDSKYHRVVENHAFGVKERLEFSVYYGIINAGGATMEIDTIVKVRGRDCYRIISRARSNSFFSKFYRVDDMVASYVETNGIYPLWFEKHLREGKYKDDRWVRFDQQRNLAINSKNDTIATPAFVQDVLSAMYYVRTLPLEVGKSAFVDNYADQKNYPLEVRVLSRERKKVDAGEFDCLVVKPLLQEGSGIFANRGELTVWLTDDQYRLPVYMKSKVIFIGSIWAQLKSYTLGEIQQIGDTVGLSPN